MNEFEVRYADICVHDIKGRLIRNPNYGGPAVGLNDWTWRPELSNHTKPGFQEELNRSIMEEGVRNPVLVWSLPEGLFLTFGGSRVKACLSTGRHWCPAIINDYTGEYSTGICVTPENVHTFFQDPPRDVEFGEYGFDYHYNLERARRHLHDPNGFAWLEGRNQDFIQQEFPWVNEED